MDAQQPENDDQADGVGALTMGRGLLGAVPATNGGTYCSFIALGMLKAAADRKEKQLFSVAELSSFSLLCTTVVFRVRISGPPLNHVSDAQ